jgi:hypothetical protein
VLSAPLPVTLSETLKSEKSEKKFLRTSKEATEIVDTSWKPVAAHGYGG